MSVAAAALLTQCYGLGAFHGYFLGSTIEPGAELVTSGSDGGRERAGLLQQLDVHGSVALVEQAMATTTDDAATSGDDVLATASTAGTFRDLQPVHATGNYDNGLVATATRQHCHRFVPLARPDERLLLLSFPIAKMTHSN